MPSILQTSLKEAVCKPRHHVTYLRVPLETTGQDYVRRAHTYAAKVKSKLQTRLLNVDKRKNVPNGMTLVEIRIVEAMVPLGKADRMQKGRTGRRGRYANKGKDAEPDPNMEWTNEMADPKRLLQAPRKTRGFISKDSPDFDPYSLLPDDPTDTDNG